MQKKVADDIGGYWGNQFDNTINQQSHIETTSEEIWTQTNGEVDGFICASGTGGTISGVSIGLKTIPHWPGQGALWHRAEYGKSLYARDAACADAQARKAGVFGCAGGPVAQRAFAAAGDGGGGSTDHQ